MKNLIIIFIAISLTSCLTERRFNRILTKGIQKGWIDTSSKTIDSVFKASVNKEVIKSKIDTVINKVFSDTTIYKDTCYTKEGKFASKKIDINKLKVKLKSNLSEKISERLICLSSPILFVKDGIVVLVSQNEKGEFIIKATVKNIVINRPEDRGWWQVYILDHLYYIGIIFMLLVIIIIPKIIAAIKPY